ncbi:MAG: DUF3788 family protein [Bacteroidia bacterium]|nr:MAG: DUF3788 family protein [Bacteroidia bacterium]
MSKNGIMETILLKDKQVFPDDKILRETLGASFSAYEEMMKTITDLEYSLIPQWNYYNDGKAWLCKAVFKKKTVLWLSVWDSYFKTAFYFTEKNSGGIEELDIDPQIKQTFKAARPTGKLIPLVLMISSNKHLPDLMKIIEYKKSLK